MLLGPHLLLHTVAELQERVVVLVTSHDVKIEWKQPVLRPFCLNIAFKGLYQAWKRPAERAFFHRFIELLGLVTALVSCPVMVHA